MEKLPYRLRIAITVFFTIIMIGTLLWEYLHEGVSTHYILHNNDMPGISNWWGLVIIPLFSWIISGFIRYTQNEKNTNPYRNLILRSLCLVVVGFIISFTFITDPASDLPFYITVLLALFLFFIPLYKAEYLLGYVLGTLFLFGAFIPVIAGSVLWMLFYTFYKGSRRLIAFIETKVNS